MRRAVDAARKAGDDGEPRVGQSGGEIACQLDRRPAGVARADQRYARLRRQRQPAAAGDNRGALSSSASSAG